MNKRKVVIFILGTLIILTLCFGGFAILKRAQSINNTSSKDEIIKINEDESDKENKKEEVKEKEEKIQDNVADNDLYSNENNNKNVKVENTKQGDGVDNVNNEFSSTKNDKKKENITTKSNDSKIEKIISDNNLEEYRDLIYSNKELFTKYSNAVEANDNLGKCKKHVYDFFKVIVDNKKYLDEEIFFDKLSNLKIVFSNTKKIGISGQYYRENNSISIYVYTDAVVYHELMHFVDSSLNSNVPRTLYYYDNKVISEEEYLKLLDYSPESHLNEISGDINYDEVAGEWSVFLSEAGAEHYSAKYFSYSHVRSYFDAVALYDIFEYLYSEEKMKDVFFGYESLYGLTDGYFTENEFKEFLNTAYTITYFKATPANADYRYILDSMIGLYNSSHDDEWYNDEDFCLLRYNFIDFDINKIEGSKYYDINKEKCEYYKNLFNSYKNNLSSYVGTKNHVYPKITYENNNIYFITFVDIETENESIVKLLYDCKNDNLKEVFRKKYSRR